MSDLLERRLKSFVEACRDARSELQTASPVTIEPRDIQDALMDVLGLDDSMKLLEGEWTRARIVETLAGYNFQRLHPELLEQIELAESILPDGVVRRLTEERIKQGGEIWHVYRNDADPWPSDPHAHNYASGHKLHLGTGGLFIGKKQVGRIDKKNLISLRKRIHTRELPPLEA
jgi:hypothetical protein